MMKTQDRCLSILMNGLLVGTLVKTTKGAYSFSYDHSWLMTSGARPVSLSLYWQRVQRRYFLGAAKAANYSVDRAEAILDDMLTKVDKVIEQVSIVLPKKFPKAISQPIFDGMQSMKQRLMVIS